YLTFANTDAPTRHETIPRTNSHIESLTPVAAFSRPRKNSNEALRPSLLSGQLSPMGLAETPSPSGARASSGLANVQLLEMPNDLPRTVLVRAAGAARSARSASSSFAGKPAVLPPAYSD